MNRKDYFVILGVVALFSFLGGVVGSRTLMPAHAQKQPKPADVTLTKSLKVVDDAGNTRLEIGTPFGEPAIFLYDSEGRSRAWFRLRRDNDASIMFVDKEDKVVWQTPEK
ncbi:MAG: hypothetical protein KIT45_07790 [Fimbriimonadia bacterium]|nr:hypothetical protein [Fimbriimonadia bacterium]